MLDAECLMPGLNEAPDWISAEQLGTARDTYAGGDRNHWRFRMAWGSRMFIAVNKIMQRESVSSHDCRTNWQP